MAGAGFAIPLRASLSLHQETTTNTFNLSKQFKKMKKIFVMTLGLMMAFSLSAKDGDGNTPNLETAARQAVEKVQSAPRDTTYGITEIKKDHITITSPFGRHRIECKDGTYSFMGMSVKVRSAKNGVYRLQTSLGNFRVDTRKATVTKE